MPATGRSQPIPRQSDLSDMHLDSPQLAAHGTRLNDAGHEPPFWTGAAGSRGQSVLSHLRDQETTRMLERAVRLHTDGELAEAGQLYQHILECSPHHFDALHLLGVLRHQQDRSVEALDLIETALQRIPDSADALSNRGIVLKALERYEEALASCDSALLIKPNHIDALSNRAQVLLRLQRFAEALSSADAALALRPDHIAALNNRGYALVKLERVLEAVETFKRVLSNRPNDLDALYDLGNALQLMGKPQEALASYTKVLARKPDRIDAVNNSGVVLQKLERFEEALASFEKALAITPKFAEAHSNRGNVLLRLGRPDEALDAYDKALAVKPSFATARNNRGTALVALNRHREAVCDFNLALAGNPGLAEVQFNRSLALIALGDFSEGWRGFEWRWDQEHWAGRRRNFAQPLWRGEWPIEGKTILLHTEQGYGDAIQFARYAPLLAARGARVVLEVHPSLKALMSTIAQVSDVVASDEPLPAFDIHCPLMSLPLAFATEVATIPATVPYILPPAERIARWKNRLPEGGAPRIGIVWAGSAAHSNNHNRSIALAQLIRILSTPDFQFVCLQKDLSKADVEILQRHGRVAVFGDEIADFADTAAIIAMVDLVVSVDTSVAHLAGALGRPLWVLLPFSADYRWMVDREDSPWYPSARLLRQPQIGDWGSVLERLQRELLRFMGRD
jgi:tetratricopeptide (TPR) repeat protein